jgi:tRNA nucleotidyltransferase (CCA-adding enzyme)
MLKKDSKNVQERLEQILKKYPLLDSIVKKIEEAGGRSFLVGGAVRDLFLDLDIKDIDIEVHGLSIIQLSDILGEFGVVDLIGKSFGVLKIHGLPIDWSIPRRDLSVEVLGDLGNSGISGRKPIVELDPNMSLESAFRRRDLTINSMGINLISKELVDPFDGLKDINNKILRATDPDFFIEDPLRLFRVMQFISRFKFFPNKELNEICKKMDISKVSRERVESEFEKMLLKSERPSLGIRWLKDIGRLKDIFPELNAVVGVPQDSQWHPEGDVFEHSMQTLDELAKLLSLEKDEWSNREKLILLYAALCHDLGKSTTTKLIEGRIKSIGHDIEGVDKTKKFLKRIMNNRDIIKAVSLLVRYHMQPLMFVKGGAGASAYKRLANKLAPHTNIRKLALLAIADRRGRKIDEHKPDACIKDVIKFIETAKNYGVYEGFERPILQGKDLLDVVSPGPELGRLVKEAYKIQIDRNIKNKDELKRLVIEKKIKVI